MGRYGHIVEKEREYAEDARIGENSNDEIVGRYFDNLAMGSFRYDDVCELWVHEPDALLSAMKERQKEIRLDKRGSSWREWAIKNENEFLDTAIEAFEKQIAKGKKEFAIEWF